ncbi:transketolase [Arcanobacterium pluranimalium]|uniref:transketolase family protein n=1 Tax=Arcanobacterium pluranimalium TaxID=108028 RepID=UPI00195DE992|nr:transketolase C-terminal domain-containing protein [Arcanobacterium pluranimalium]MBM7825691.1 transketolase [Arcanobacterium pluranimalium]
MAGGLTYTMLDGAEMATAEVYGRTLVELAKEHPEIVGFSGDLAKSTKIGLLADAFPERFFNVGIAEQNMFGMAAGMAKCGYVPFVSTFASFATLRALEQLRTDICYGNANVKVIATHSGLSFGQAGSTHQSPEDFGILRSISNLVTLCPADGMATAQAVEAVFEHVGPAYVRVNRGFDQKVYNEPIPDFRIGGSHTLMDGSDITIMASGAPVWRALQAAERLRSEDGLSVRVIDLYSIKPLDEETIKAAVAETRRVITVEDANIAHGLGSAVADIAARTGKGFAFRKLGIPDKWSMIGQPEDLFAHYGYDENGILETARELMRIEIEEDDDWDDEV